jgi:hypothetical protein
MKVATDKGLSVGRAAAPALLIGSVSGVAAVWVLGTEPPPALAFTTVGIVCFAMFFRLGGVNLVPSAIFFYSLGLVGGVSGLLALAVESPSSGGLGEVAFMLLVVSLGGSILALCADKAPLSHRGSPWGTGGASWDDIQWLRFLGVGMLISAVVTLPVRELGPIGPALSYVGVLCVVLAAALAFDRSRRVALTSYAPFVAVASAVYLVTAFSGGGRVVVAELGLAALICVGLLRPARWAKLVLTAGIMPVIVLVGLVGQVRGGEDFALAQIQDADTQLVINTGAGLGSVYAPVVDSARLIEMNRRNSAAVPLAYGTTALDLALVLVPRALWQEKPEQLGKTIVQVLQPQLAFTDQSLAVGIWGEGFVNFRYIGFVAYPLLIAWIALKSDSLVPRIRHVDDERRRLVLLVAVAATASSIPDLLWGGFGTFAARGGARLVILTAIAGVLATSRRHVPARAERIM